jgi:hypothetical protein
MSEVITKAPGVILSPGDVHINGALTNVSLAYMQSATNFIASQVFPVVPVQKQSDLIWNFEPEQFNRNLMRKRAPSTEAAIAGMQASTVPYYAHVWALGSDISDQTRSNADGAWNLDRQYTEFLTNSALISREQNFINTFLTTGVWGTDWTGVAATPGANQFLQWDNPASTPIEDIRSAARLIQRRTGFRPNKFVLGRKTFDILVDHPDIVDRVKYGQTPNGAALVNMQALSALFETDRVIVANAVENVGGVTDFVFDNGALLVYSPDNAAPQMPAAGLTYSWTGYTGANGVGGRIFKFRMDHLRSDRLEIELAYDQRVTGETLGLFFNSAVVADA